MLKKLVKITVLAATLFISNAQAGLLGSTASANYYHPGLGSSNAFNLPSAVVTSGIEWPLYVDVLETVDIGDDFITFSFRGKGSRWDKVGDFIGYVFNFEPDALIGLTGFSFAHNGDRDFVDTMLSLEGNLFYINWGGARPAGDITINFEFDEVAPPTGVPEPSTYVLLGLALATLLIFKKHKASACCSPV